MSTQHSIIEHRANYFYVRLEDDYLAMYERINKEIEALELEERQTSGPADCKAMIASILEHWMNSKRINAKCEEDLYVYFTYEEWEHQLRYRYKRSVIIRCLKEMPLEGQWLDGQGDIHVGTIIVHPYVQNTFAYLLNVKVVQGLLAKLPEQSPYGPKPRVALGRPRKNRLKENDLKINGINLNGLNSDGNMEMSSEFKRNNGKYHLKINGEPSKNKRYYGRETASEGALGAPIDYTQTYNYTDLDSQIKKNEANASVSLASEQIIGSNQTLHVATTQPQNEGEQDVRNNQVYSQRNSGIGDTVCVIGAMYAQQATEPTGTNKYHVQSPSTHDRAQAVTRAATGAATTGGRREVLATNSRINETGGINDINTNSSVVGSSLYSRPIVSDSGDSVLPIGMTSEQIEDGATRAYREIGETTASDSNSTVNDNQLLCWDSERLPEMQLSSKQANQTARGNEGEGIIANNNNCVTNVDNSALTVGRATDNECAIPVGNSQAPSGNTQGVYKADDLAKSAEAARGVAQPACKEGVDAGKRETGNQSSANASSRQSGIDGSGGKRGYRQEEKNVNVGRGKRVKNIEVTQEVLIPNGVLLTEDEQRVFDFYCKLWFIAVPPKVTSTGKQHCATLAPFIKTQEDMNSLEKVSRKYFNSIRVSIKVLELGNLTNPKVLNMWKAEQMQAPSDTPERKTGSTPIEIDPNKLVIWTRHKHSGRALDHWYLYEEMPVSEAQKYGWKQEAIVPNDKTHIRVLLRSFKAGKRELTSEQQAELKQFQVVA